MTFSNTSHKITDRLIWQIGAAAFIKLLLNTARRFAYPFAPVLSRELGVSLPAITSLIAVNQATSILGVIFGPYADRFGYRLTMTVALGILIVGMFSGGLFAYYGAMVVCLFLAGLAKSIFDPAIQAYVGHRVPFHRRGLFIGVFEFSWAGSTLLGIPLMALLLDRYGWQSPFLVMGVLGGLGIMFLRIVFPENHETSTRPHKDLKLSQFWGLALKNKATLGALAFSFFVSVSNDNLFIAYGAWLENDFSLGIVALGLGTSVIGMAELCGECLTAAISDRIGLKRSVIIGMILTTAIYGILPFISTNLPYALGGLFALFFIFEFSIVSALSLCTELTPQFRATTMSGFFAASGIGRVVGALIGIPVWLNGGILFTGAASAVLNTIGLVLLVWGLKDWRR